MFLLAVKWTTVAVAIGDAVRHTIGVVLGRVPISGHRQGDAVYASPQELCAEKHGESKTKN
jgi:hypothetical protein